MAKVAVQDLDAFLRSLLDKGAVEALMALKFTESPNKVAYSLVPKGGDVNGLAPLFPFMPANAGRALSRLTMEGPLPQPVAAVLRPCELRALVELVKLEQANLDNLYIIGVECGGVYPLSKMVKEKGEPRMDTYLQLLKNGETPQDVRPVCGGCDQFQPVGADVVVSLVGREEPQLAFVSERGLQLAQALGMGLDDGETYTPVSQELLQKRQENRDKLITSIKSEVKGLQGLESVFGKCIGCHCCSKVCPICYCKDCFFESSTFDYEPISYSQRMEKKSALRVPMDTVLFHLGRMTHMATSCVACGMCEDACPTGIPVSQVFKAVGSDLQDLFGYLPGRSLQEELPLTTYRSVEFTEVED
jgi:formate dehydrogenase subunit beta